MTKILAIGSPKGGVGKSTEAIHLARIASEQGLSVLLVDADDNHSTVDWADTADDTVAPFDVASATGAAAEHLSDLRRGSGYDLIVVDLPGAREGAFRTVLTGTEVGPVPDLLLVPVKPRLIDIKPVARVIGTEVTPLGLPYLLVLTMVRTASLHLAQERAQQLREGSRLAVADTLIRDYSAYDEAHERGRTVLDIGGEKHPTARTAETEQRALASEVLDQLHLNRKDS